MKNLWQETPLIYSSRLSEITNASVYLKLENLHPSHSFKYRGISHFIQKASEQRGPSVHLVIASGGNAGFAAMAIPDGASKRTLETLMREKAGVVVGGQQYSEALESAMKLVENNPKAIIVPAYDNPTLWEGHISMIQEVNSQLQQEPDATVCSVGGGGLLGGIIVGCKNVGWGHDRCRSMSEEKKALPPGVNLVYNEEHSVYLAYFTTFPSKASGSLGALEPAAGVVRMALERIGGVKTASLPDELSMHALASFANDHKLLVELACSTALVPAYNPAFFDKLVPPNAEKGGDSARVVVFIVCGGFKIDLETVAEYQATVDGHPGSWRLNYDDGHLFNFEK